MADCYVQSANQEVKFLSMANTDFEPGSESQTRWQNDLSKKKDKKNSCMKLPWNVLML